MFGLFLYYSFTGRARESMSQKRLSNRILANLKVTGKSYFIRDTTLRGLGVKVTPKGQKKFIVEVWHNNSSIRKTIGEFPYMSLKDARKEALPLISDIKSGEYARQHEVKRKEISLEKLFTEYLGCGRLKESTIADYKVSINYYQQDWLSIPVNEITKKMVEKRFYLIRDKGIKGGISTHCQAAKTMRVLSALMNYARGDDLIEVNPLEILKLKKVDQSIKGKTSYFIPQTTGSEGAYQKHEQ